jgi:DNA-binding transcriptional LysR family regulator
MTQLAAARAGLGLALLPCFLADQDPALNRVLVPVPGVASGLWLLTLLHFFSGDLTRIFRWNFLQHLHKYHSKTVACR